MNWMKCTAESAASEVYFREALLLPVFKINSRAGGPTQSVEMNLGVGAPHVGITCEAFNFVVPALHLLHLSLRDTRLLPQFLGIPLTCTLFPRS